MSVGAVVLTFLAYLFTFLGFIVPIVEAVLLAGVYMALLFFAAAGHSKRPNQGEGNVEGASSSHGSLRCQWNKTQSA